jgi:hypothetical protein
MSTSSNATAPELPGPPDPRGVNVQHNGPVDEAAFIYMYGRYSGTEHYEDAKKVFLTRTLNNSFTGGVNTWHEQVLAGRISMDDLKVMGYSNLARLRSRTKEILIALTREHAPMTPAEMKIALKTSSTSLMFGLNPPMSRKPSENLPYTMHYANQFGKDAQTLRYHWDIYNAAGPSIQDLNQSNYFKALELTLYVDQFFAALQEYITPGKLRPYNTDSYPVTYRNDEFILLKDAEITPAQAAKFLINGLSARRAVAAKDVPDSPLIEGVL